jgi:aminocarboxymuconate-semialdehyde decarboxylase
MTPSIDIHTHMLDRDWLELLRQHGKPLFELRKSLDAAEGIMMDGAPFMTPMPGHFDYEYRIKRMDEAKVDLAIVSLTCPNVYFGGPEVSLKGAQIVNDSMAEAQKTYPSRIRFLCSLPWEYPDLAVKELARACDRGAVGVMVLANIGNKSLTDPLFAPVWKAIDQRALPVLVHPTAPPGTPVMDMRQYNLIASIGFMFDTSLCFARMFFDGFLDLYPNLKLIASHAGGTLPFLVGRLDQCFDNMNACRTKTQTRPSDYLRRIYYDAVTYRPESLKLAIEVGGESNVMYGSDYPHNIGDMIGCLKRVDDLPPGQRDAVRGKNAQRVFRL